LENILAHEATHAYLRYVKGYFSPDSSHLDPLEREAHNCIGTMLEDIVIDKMMTEYGFILDRSIYFNTIRSYTIPSFLEGKNPFAHKPEAFAVYRYVLANEMYYEVIDIHGKSDCKKCMQLIEEKLPAIASKGRACLRSIQNGDLFTHEGYDKIYKEVEAILEL